MNPFIIFALISSIIAIVYGLFLIRVVLKKGTGDAKMQAIAKAIQERFDDMDYLFDLGDISLNISGCINSCGHHHVGNIGVLGIDKNGEEWYQITLGGEQGNDAAIGKVIGPSFYANQIPDVMTNLINTYVELRTVDEPFIDTYRRLGVAPFKVAAYQDNENNGKYSKGSAA